MKDHDGVDALCLDFSVTNRKLNGDVEAPEQELGTCPAHNVSDAIHCATGIKSKNCGLHVNSNSPTNWSSSGLHRRIAVTHQDSQRQAPVPPHAAAPARGSNDGLDASATSIATPRLRRGRRETRDRLGDSKVARVADRDGERRQLQAPEQRQWEAGEIDDWRPRRGANKFDLSQRCTGASPLARHVRRRARDGFDDSLFRRPSAGEARCRVRRAVAVRHLFLREVAPNEVFAVAQVLERRNRLHVHAEPDTVASGAALHGRADNSTRLVQRRPQLVCEALVGGRSDACGGVGDWTRDGRCGGTAVAAAGATVSVCAARGADASCCWLLRCREQRSVRTLSSLHHVAEPPRVAVGIEARARSRVQVHAALLFARVRRRVLHLDERVFARERVLHVRVHALHSLRSTCHVNAERVVVERRQQVVRVHEQNLGACLAEAEALHHRSLDPRRLDAAVRVELAQALVRVVEVLVAWDEPRVEHLQQAVDHVRCRCTLRVARQVLLAHDRQRVPCGASEVRELLLGHLALVPVVPLRARAVEARDANVVDRQVPDAECAAQGRDVVAALKEALPPRRLRRLHLALLHLLQVLQVALASFAERQSSLVREPGVDACHFRVELAASEGEIKRRTRRTSSLAGGSQDTLARSGHGPPGLVGRSVCERDDAVDRTAHLERQLRVHDAVALHEAPARRRARATHLSRLSPHRRLLHRVARRLHLRKLVRAFFAKVVDAADDHDARLAALDRLDADLDRLGGRGAGANRGLDRAGRAQQQHVDPRRRGIDEALLENVARERLALASLPEDASQSTLPAHCTA
ncbi:hypothetical protein PybrP1_002871 [[Pythium] brassicae (nom. inval.)]|nr:hypothetical protein PybrP1_002871 [[Pythium] brassicae (nom. inval.)]